MFEVAIFGVAGGGRAPGAQVFEIVELQTKTAQVELDVLKQRSVPVRQDETVAPQPLVIGRVMVHDVLIEQMRHWRETHRGAGVATLCEFDRVCGEQAGGVGCALVEFGPVHSAQGGSSTSRRCCAVWLCFEPSAQPGLFADETARDAGECGELRDGCGFAAA